jgi:hypothetical protein
MIKKMVVVIAASVLAVGLSVSAVSAKTTKHAKHKAKPAAAAQVQTLPNVPGNNPIVHAAQQTPIKNAPKPEGIKGNNAMGVATK